MLKYFFAYILLFLSLFSDAQSILEKGMPFVQNYLPENYGNHGKIWDVKSAKNGMIYMASEDGLLEFDGKIWSHFKSYRGYTRSLYVANDSTIYAGADMDFGVWKKDKFRKFSFTSMYPFKKKIGGVNEEFWGTYQIKNQMVFVSHQNIYISSYKKLTKLSAKSRFSKSFFVNGRLFLADEKKGLFEYDGSQLKLLFPFTDNNPLDISGVFINGNALRIVTKNKGIFEWNNGKLTPLSFEVSPSLIKGKVFSFINLGTQYYAFGTILDGIYITDLNGKIIQHINKSKGLPNNTVLCMHYQKNGKLWLGLDYGISSVDIKNDITYFYSQDDDFGTGYTAAFKDDTFFLGSNQGLYFTDWNEMGNPRSGTFLQMIEGSEGQVWTLKNIDGDLYCGHDKGLFVLDKNSLKKINNEYGVSAITPFRKDYVLTGNYSGVFVYKKENNTLKFIKKMHLIVGAVSQIEVENDHTIWINIPNYGILRTTVDDNFNPVNRQIFPDNNFKGNLPNIYRIHQKIKIFTTAEQYDFNNGNNKFFPATDKIQLPVISGKLPGFYIPQKISTDYNFFPVYNGFALEKLNLQNKERFSSGLIFRKAEMFNNTGNFDLETQQQLPYRFNNLRFVFSLPNEDAVEYSYFLDGFSKDWSVWSSDNKIEFLGLKEGSYSFLVKAKKGNQISDVKAFYFRVKAPWYRSLYSYAAYFLLIAGLFYFLKKYQENKLKKQKLELLKKEQNALREQAEKHRQEMILEKQKQLENEKNNLKEEIKSKTIELATKAKEDEDKNRLLSTINEKILEIENNPNISKIRLGEIRRTLKTYLETDDHTFEIQMDELHQEFFKAMRKKFPNLSIYDLRLCAYLKIGLNSKEMADIFQVLPSSINVSRSRLRKKLGLKPEDDLFDFLNNLE
ncbi:hypothetical protein H9Q08_19565 [Chryseobacterium sp. PS-8]|uniref:Two component regulator three Y domain-containing protein n=1 Tax=Chryseobacterium indicum TaxID=2766954 RepID=A0ABS9CBC3_9FLAO|nr:triple tyrosine motif-containing protein [Chryseobacterium sp. PS-8]MCF2221467.1 hypothetical protein [Chryseobacterium sp. PS-8]